MNETDESKRMTVAEIALMRAIVQWRKANSIEFVKRSVMGTYWVDPFGETGAKRRSVAIELKHAPSTPMGTAPSGGASYTWHAVETFTQAVDVLVALGYLPARFSSAYRAGWDAGRDDARYGYEHTEYLRVMPAVPA